MPDLVDRNKYGKLVPPRKYSPIWDDSRNVDMLMTTNVNKFKKLVRDGVPDELRCLVWSKILRLNELQDFERNYKQAIKQFGLDKAVKSKFEKVPTFGGEFNVERFALSEEGERVVKNVMTILAHEYPSLEFCPALPTIISLLAHHFGPDDLLGAMRVLVKSSLDTSQTTFFPCTFKTMMLFYESFGALLQRHAPKVFRHLKKIEEEMNIVSPFWIKWMNNFCVDILCFNACFRLIDTFLLEGYKVVYRFGIGASLLRLPQILHCLSLDQFEELFEKHPVGATSPNGEEDKLVRASFNISFSRKDVKRIQEDRSRQTSENHGSFPRIDQLADSKIAPKIAEESAIVKDDHWPYVWSWIPKRFRTMDLQLLFSTEAHGYYLETFYSRCSEGEPQLLFIETTEGAIFGAYLSESWSHNPFKNFFGTNESFLFTLQPVEEVYPWVGHQSSAEITPEQAKHLKENASMFIYGTNKYFAIGGGGVNYGLSLDESLSKGTTGTCFTFNNPPLTGNINTFEVRNLEVFTFI